MLFMVIETFQHNPKAVYRRFREKGRQMPDGLEFIDSWVTADFSRCFQLMRCGDVTLLQRLPWLFVIARNSAFTFKGRAVDVNPGERL